MNLLRHFVRHCHLQLNTPLPIAQSISGLISHDNYDLQYYNDIKNFDEICANIKMRKMENDFPDIMMMHEKNDLKGLAEAIQTHVSRLPNRLHHVWSKDENDARTSEVIESPPKFDFEPKTMETLMQRLGLLYLSDKTVGNLGPVGGNRSYAILGDLSRLENAIIRWTLKTLINDYQFTPTIVPQLVYDEVINACGFDPHAHRSQVYGLNGDERVCLPGTSEIPLAALNIGETIDENELPKKYCAMSRCFRAEAKTTKEKAGLFRVHYFTKVEMFALTTKDQSDSVLEHFIDIQKTLYNELGLNFKVIDMPPHELGLPASRKYDCEAYFAGRKSWGEISSASNCTDFQSRRLNIKYRTLALNEETNEIFRDDFVHTVNGTGCASPRILVALCEHYQTKSGHIQIPLVLQPFMDGQKLIDKKLNLFDNSNKSDVMKGRTSYKAMRQKIYESDADLK